MQNHNGGIEAGYLPAAAGPPSLRPLALLLSEASGWGPEARACLGWLLSRCPSVQKHLQALDDLRQEYELEASTENLSYAIQLQKMIKAALEAIYEAAGGSQ